MADFTSYLRLAVDSRDVKNAATDLSSMAGAGDKAAKSATNLGAVASRAFGLIAGAVSAAKVTDYANQWTDLNSRVLNAVKSQEAANEVIQSISATSRSTYSSLQQTADAFLQNNLVLTELGYSTRKQIEFSDALNNSMVISGAKGQGAATALGALGRVMAEGTMKSQEFNLLMTYSSRTVEALAAGLNTSTIELRKMVAAGEITGDKLFAALTSQLERLRQEADAMPATVGDAVLQVSNSFLRLTGTINDLSGASDTISSSILNIVDSLNEFSDNLDDGKVAYYFDTVTNAAIALSAVIGTRMVSSYVMATAASMKVAQTARLETAAYAESAAMAARAAVEKQTQAVASIKAEQAMSAARMASLRSVQAQIAAEISLEKTRYAAQINDIGRAKTVNRMATLGAERANVAKQIAAAESAQLAIGTRLTTAQAAQAATSNTLGAANARLAASTTALSVASRAAAAGMALLGGPLGVVLVAATAFSVLTSRVEESDYAIHNINGTVDEAIKKFEQMKEEQRAFAELSLQNKIDEDRKKIDELTDSLGKFVTRRDELGQERTYFYADKVGDEAVQIRSQIVDLTEAIEENQAKLEAFANIAPAWMINLARSIDAFATSQKNLVEDDATEIISDNYKKLAQDIEKRIALFGTQGEAAALAYDLERGLIEGVDAAQGKYLLTRYKYIDTIRAEENVRKALDAMFEREEQYRIENQESVSATIAALEQEVLQLEIGEVAYLAYSLAMKGATEEEIRAAVAAKQRSIEIRKAGKETKQATEEAKGFGASFVSSFDGIFESIIDGSEDAYDVVVKGFKSMLIAMAKEALLNPIMVKVGQEGASGSGGGNAGNAASGLLAGGWWAAIAAAVVVGVGEHNKNQAEKFAEMTSEIRQARQSTGTLLGMANEKSESLGNSIDDLLGLGNDTLGVNRDQYRALIDIRSGLAGVAAGFARSIAFNPGTDVRTGSWAMASLPTTRDALDKLNLPTNQLTGFVTNFLGGLTDKVMKELFKKSVKVTDTGISILGDSLAGIMEDGVIQAFNYADVQTKKKVLGITTSTKMKTTEESIGDDFNRQITSVFESAGKSLGIAGATFGLDIQDFAGRLVVDTQRISLKDLSAEEITQELEYFLSSTMDKWAQTMIGNTGVLERYQNAGEGAFETMIRLSSQTEYLVNALDQVNLVIPATGVAAIDLVQSIAQMSGGFEELQSSLSAYYDKFFSDQEKMENMTARLSDVTKDLLQTLPTTREEFRAIVESLDLTTESGARAFSELMSVSGAIDQYITALDRQNSALVSAASSALNILKTAIDQQKSGAQGLLDKASDAKSALDKALDAERNRLTKLNQEALASLNAQKSAQSSLGNVAAESLKKQKSLIEQNIGSMQKLSESLRNTVAGLSSQEPEKQIERFYVAAGKISGALAGTFTGNLEDAIKAIGGVDRNAFSSQFESEYALASVSNNMLALADATDKQLTIEEKLLAGIDSQIASAERYYQASLSAVDRQIESANAALEKELAALDEMAAAALSQLNALLGIDDSVLSLEEAFAALEEAYKNAEGAYEEIQLLDELLASSQREYDRLTDVNDGIGDLNVALENFAVSIRDAQIATGKQQQEGNQNLILELQALRAETRANAAANAELQRIIANYSRTTAQELETQRRLAQ